MQELSKTGFCVPIAQKAKPQPAYFSCSFNPLVGILKTYCNTSAIQFSLQGTGSIIWLAVHYIVYNKQHFLREMIDIREIDLLNHLLGGFFPLNMYFHRLI